MTFPEHQNRTRKEEGPRPTTYELDVRMLRLSKDRGYVFVNPEAVWMLKAAQQETFYFLTNGEVYTGCRSITALMKELPGLWMRLNRTYAIKPSHVISITRGKVLMSNGETYPISRRQFRSLYYCSIMGGQFKNSPGRGESLWWADA